MARSGLAGRITAVSFALCCCALVVALAANYWISVIQAEKELRDLADRRSRELASSVENLLWSFDYETVALVGDAYMASREMAALRIRAVTEGGEDDVYRHDAPGRGDVVHGSADVVHEGELLGRVEIGLNRAPYTESLLTLLGASIPITLIVAVALFLVMKWLFRKYLGRPLEALADWTDLVSRGDYSQAPEVLETEELRHIVRKFSDMYRQVGAREQSLRTSEKRFRDLTELLPAMVFETDLDGRLVFVNRAGMEGTGYVPEDFAAGLFDADVVHSGDLEELKRYFSAAADSSLRGGREFQLLRKDGTTFPALVYVSRAVEDGRAVGLRGVAIDISDQKVLESQLARAGKLEAIGTLAGGVAHDFNNILAAILGYSELSLMNDKMDPEDRQNLEMVCSAANRAKSLVKQILTFSRMEQEDQGTVSIHPVVEDALSLVRKTLPATIHIEPQLDPEAGAVCSDATNLHQIVMNLCTNSAHAMAEREGTIRVTLRRGKPDARAAARHPHLQDVTCAQLVVEDTGEGIEPDLLGKIFDPFFTTKEVGQGTGMGLAVVHGIVTRSGGAVDVESEPGVGTTVTVYWPSVEPQAGAPSSESLPVRSGDGQRILFVDDEAQIVDLGRRVLGGLNYAVDTVSSPVEALEMFRSAPDSYDLIISDQSMPGLSGHGLALEALRIRPDIPIILCSGYSEVMNSEKARELGVRAFLTKPVSRAELADAAYRVLHPES